MTDIEVGTGLLRAAGPTLFAEQFEQFHVVMNPDALTKVIEEFDHGEGLLGCPVGRDIEWDRARQAGGRRR